MSRLPFVKYHGLGNDFVVVDLRSGEPTPSPQAPAFVRAVCDRHFGVGADGILAILPPTVAGADARMRVLNADGSEAEMCGNGIRCVAKHLAEREPALRRSPLHIETLAGVLACGISAGADHRVTAVAVEMGRPRLRRAEIPMTGPADERCLEQPLEAAGQALRVSAVSMGNPHAVAFVHEPGADLLAMARECGPSVENSAWFPRRTNAEFARLVSPAEIDLVVWERGCGITLACGTGACATAVAACATGRAEPGREISVHLPGGTLGITVAADYSGVTMRGPATMVFEGFLESSLEST